MAIININGKVFHAEPQWEEWLLNTDFTKTADAYLHKYYIDDVEVTKELFEEEYKLALG